MKDLAHVQVPSSNACFLSLKTHIYLFIGRVFAVSIAEEAWKILSSEQKISEPTAAMGF